MIFFMLATVVPADILLLMSSNAREAVDMALSISAP